MNCSSCNAPIRFAPSEHGKPMPLDEQPLLTGGTYEIGEDGVARFVSATARAGKPPLFIPHFATCTNADAHRKGRRKK